VDQRRPWVCSDGVCWMVWTKSRPGECTGGLWGWESWSLWRLASVVRGRWKEGGTGKPLSNPCRNPPSLPFAERPKTKLSPWPRLLHKTYITVVIGRRPDTGTTITTAMSSHHPRRSKTPPKPLPCFCCTTSHYRDYAGRQYGRDGPSCTSSRMFIHAKTTHHFSAAPIPVTCAGGLPPKRWP